MTTQTLQTSINLIQADATLSALEKSAAISALTASMGPLADDKIIYRLVVVFLGFTVVVTVVGGIWLAYIGGSSPNYQLPQGVIAIGSAAVGALAGLLAPAPSQAKTS